MVFVVKLPIFSMPACAANNRKTAITCCSNFVCLNNCLSLNLQSMVNKSKTMVFWKLVCTSVLLHCFQKNQLERQRDSYKINAAREESSRHSVPGCHSKAKCTWNAKISTETVPVFLLKIRPRIFVGEINWIEQKTSKQTIGHCRNVRGLGKSMVVFRLLEKLRCSNERSTKFESLYLE